MYAKCMRQHIKTSPQREAFVFLKIGDYQIGVTLSPLSTCTANLDDDANYDDRSVAVAVVDADADIEHVVLHDTLPVMPVILRHASGHSHHLRTHINAKLAHHRMVVVATCRDALTFIVQLLRIFMWRLTPTLSAHNSNSCS